MNMEATSDIPDAAILRIFESLHPRTNLNIMDKNDRIRCSLDNETNSISEASHIHLYLLSHPCEDVEAEEIQKLGTMLGTLRKEENERDTFQRFGNTISTRDENKVSERNKDARLPDLETWAIEIIIEA